MTKIAEIEKLSNTGAGITRLEGKVTFIHGVVPGDTVELSLIEEHAGYNLARLERVVDPAPTRIDPPCPHFLRCGGCNWLNVSYDEQLRQKQLLVKETLIQIAKIPPEQANRLIQPIVPSTEQYHYRNKCIFWLGKKKGQVFFGFYQRNSRTVVPIDNCYLETELAEKARAVLNDIFRKQPMTKVIWGAMVRTSFMENKLQITLLINEHRISKEMQSLIDQSTEKIPSMIPELGSLNIILNRNNGIAPTKGKLVTLWGHRTLEEELKLSNSIYQLHLSPRSFHQANHSLTPSLFQTAVSALQPQADQIAFDLYAGMGTISYALSPYVRQVYAFESEDETVAYGKKSLKRLAINNIQLIKLSTNHIYSYSRQHNINPDLIMLDPPRNGASNKTLKAIIKLNPRRIAYISCNIATLSRDIKILSEQGYLVKQVTPFDMFPQTYHIENIAVLDKA